MPDVLENLAQDPNKLRFRGEECLVPIAEALATALANMEASVEGSSDVAAELTAP
jgi:hypothetical protein